MTSNIKTPISTKLVIKDITNECRICLENNGKELIYPCKCKFPVHRECLIKWLNSDSNINPNKCEICKTNYNSDFVIIINRNIDRNIHRNIDRNISRRIINYERRLEIIRRKQCFGVIFFTLLTGDVVLSYYYYCFDNNELNLYSLLFANFIFFCLFGTINSFINSNGYMSID